MKDFDRKVGEASARINKTVAEAAANLEKESAEFITYLNNEVVPAVRQHSTKALRIAVAGDDTDHHGVPPIRPPRLGGQVNEATACLPGHA